MTKTKIVPIEPTEDMYNAGHECICSYMEVGKLATVDIVYKAMLEVAPPVEDVIKNVTYSDGSPSREWEDGDNSGTKTKHKCAYWTDDSWCCMVGGCGCAQPENTPDNAEALAAFENWLRDGERFTTPFGELTMAEANLCDHADAIRAALTNQSIQGCDEVVVRKSDLTKAAAVLMLPNNGVCDTIWYADATTLYEHLVGLAEIDDLSGIVEEDYQRLSGEPYPQPPEQKGE